MRKLIRTSLAIRGCDVQIAIKVAGNDPLTIQRLIQSDTLAALVTAFEELHKNGGPDLSHTLTLPFAKYSRDEFKNDVVLRASGIKWLLFQLLLPINDPFKLIPEQIGQIEDLKLRHIHKYLENIRLVYQELTHAIHYSIHHKKFKPAARTLQNFGYPIYRFKEEILICAKSISEFGPASHKGEYFEKLALLEYNVFGNLGLEQTK